MNIKTYTSFSIVMSASNDNSNFNLYKIVENPTGSGAPIIIKNLSITGGPNGVGSFKPIIMGNVLMFITNINSLLVTGSHTYNSLTESFSMSFMPNTSFSSSYKLIDCNRMFVNYETKKLTGDASGLYRPLDLLSSIVLSSSQKIMLAIKGGTGVNEYNGATCTIKYSYTKFI